MLAIRLANAVLPDPAHRSPTISWSQFETGKSGECVLDVRDDIIRRLTKVVVPPPKRQ